VKDIRGRRKIVPGQKLLGNAVFTDGAVNDNVLYHSLLELASSRRVLGTLERWGGPSRGETAAL